MILLLSINSYHANEMVSSLTRRGFCSLAFAQEDVTFKSGVNVVNILASVRDAKGVMVNNLQREDFELTEDGASQQITYFARETGLPLSLGLLIDTSMSQQPVLDAQRTASYRFFDRVLRDGIDKVFLMQFDMGVYVKQKLTGSRADLENALSLVDTPTRRELSMQVGGGTLLYEAIKQGAAILMPLANRKALIVLTDGIDTGSDASLSECIEAAQRADVMLYTIYFPGASTFAPVDGGRVLDRMARLTGGAFFSVQKRLTIQGTFDQIQEELRGQYSIGFVSSKPVGFPAYRKLKLTTKRRGLNVRARDGYWPVRAANP
jgi:VWFA-related protein